MRHFMNHYRHDENRDLKDEDHSVSITRLPVPLEIQLTEIQDNTIIIYNF